MFRESFVMSLQNIRGNKMRSFLTMLGIIIGVTAIIALITIVTGVTNEVTSRFTELGAGKINVRANGTVLKRGITESDMQKLSQIENIAGVSPNVSLTLPVSNGGTLTDDVIIEGRSDIYFRNNDVIAAGRPLSPVDMDPHSRVCVINAEAAREFFLQQNPLGGRLVIGGLNYTVVGVLKDSDNDVMSQMNRMMNSAGKINIVIPYKAALRMTGMGNITSLELYMTDTGQSEETMRQIEMVLDQAFNFKDNSYSLINLDSLLDTMNTITSMMTTMLAGIAAIALLVGGIGIMNMMLVSVTERTTEIGLRKALGAKPSIIQTQFLMESVVLSLLGGLIGILLGNLISYVVAYLIGFTFVMSVDAVAIGFFFSAGIGVLFGWAPANKASRLNPIDALRSM
ncbi:MAG: ABC transporter permease [Clostridia bacterium]|nr:ABC transporter permease [Clostridia bacterium]